MADVIVMCGKKDELVNVGGFVGVREGDDLYEQAHQRGILFEGVFDVWWNGRPRPRNWRSEYARQSRNSIIESRARQSGRQTRYTAIGSQCSDSCPDRRPRGRRQCQRVPSGNSARGIPWTGTRLCDLPRGGVRAVEPGEFAFRGEDRPQLIQLCLPRRTHFRDHLEHVAETFAVLAEHREELSGYEIVDESAE